jgi:hypothetical protein
MITAHFQGKICETGQNITVKEEYKRIIQKCDVYACDTVL